MAEIDWQLAGAQAAATDIGKWAEAAIKAGRDDIKALITEALQRALERMGENGNG